MVRCRNSPWQIFWKLSRRINGFQLLTLQSLNIAPHEPTGTCILREIQLHCPDDACNGTRFFRCISEGPTVRAGVPSFEYLTYRCSNCQRKEKTFSLAVARDKDKESGFATKFGEFPPFGPPTPPRLVKLIGPDRELFLKGRRCENQGLGIGAFVYYRRVVEHQKARIFDEIIKVAKKLNAPEQTIMNWKPHKTRRNSVRLCLLLKKESPRPYSSTVITLCCCCIVH